MVASKIKHEFFFGFFIMSDEKVDFFMAEEMKRKTKGFELISRFKYA